MMAMWLMYYNIVKKMRLLLINQETRILAKSYNTMTNLLQLIKQAMVTSQKLSKEVMKFQIIRTMLQSDKQGMIMRLFKTRTQKVFILPQLSRIIVMQITPISTRMRPTIWQQLSKKLVPLRRVYKFRTAVTIWLALSSRGIPTMRVRHRIVMAIKALFCKLVTITGLL